MTPTFGSVLSPFASLALVAMTVPGSSEISPRTVACTVDYEAADWGGGFTARLRVNNLGDPADGWSLTFTFPGNQRVTPPGWSANWSQPSGSPNVTANGDLATGQTAEIGFNCNGWNANWDQAPGSAPVTASNVDHNPAIGAGTSVEIGFDAGYSGANARPAAFTLNDQASTA